MHEKSPSYWIKWQNILFVVFAGGVETVKVIAPIAGIPIEIGRGFMRYIVSIKKLNP
jgi:hypothetical protein